jgi:hypothetical protein
MRAPIEAKVKASSAAALVSGVIVWLLGKYVLKSGVGSADQALIYAAVPLVLTALAGYFAPHTYRPVPPPAPVTPPPAAPSGVG